MPSSSTTKVTESLPNLRAGASSSSRERLPGGLLALSLATWLGVGLPLPFQTSFARPADPCRAGVWVMDQSASPNSARCARGTPGPREERMGGAPGLLFGRPLDVNTAAPHDLTAIPGIGPARAEAIADARRHAPYTSLDDVTRARGVGPGTIARIEAWVTVLGAPAAPRSPQSSDAAPGDRL